MPDSVFSRGVLRAFPKDDRLFGWTIKNLGPLYIPKMGDSIKMNAKNFKLYKLIIEYETGHKPQVKDDKYWLNNEVMDSYTFSENYYYFCGDNAPDSKDSRYLGFVPEEFIIGVVNRISYSKDKTTNKIRWDRMWKKLKTR